MDFSFVMRNIKPEDEFGIKSDLLNKTNSPGLIMEEDWSPGDDILNSLFHDNDFLNNFDAPQPTFDSIEGLSACIKMEAENYEMSDSTLPSNLLDDSKFISSNSSDSGLSSDILDIEMSPAYEPLSPAMSSPGPSISERGSNNSPPRIEASYVDFPSPVHISQNQLPVEKPKPKVIVQKVPQMVNISKNDICRTQPKFNMGINSKEIKIVKIIPQAFNNINNKKVTIQVKHPNSIGKIQAKPGTLYINKGKLTEVKKLVRVQNPTNSRSILNHVPIQEMKDVRTFKIVNIKPTPVTLTAATAKPTIIKAAKPVPVPIPVTKPVSPIQSTSRLSYDDSYDQMSDTDSIIIEDGFEDDKPDDDFDSAYPKLVLSAEEKRLLSKEGISLPSHYPLTKHEERELKRIRRKIRNKISAQDSRKRKKEYVDGLEERVKQCTEENLSLMKRIKHLQSQNQNLISQMKKLQNLLTKGTNKTANPTTCLMVLLLSLALVAAPNLKLGQNVKESDLQEAVQNTILQNRRNLLYDQQSTDIFDEEINMSDILSAAEMNSERESAMCKKTGEPNCKKLKLSSDFVDFDVDDQNWYKTKEKMAEKKVVGAMVEEKKPEHGYSFDKTFQTSGFNIETDDPQNWLDKDILDMITPTSNGVYELNLEKLSEGYMTPPESVVDVQTKRVYSENGNQKLNASEMGSSVQKY